MGELFIGSLVLFCFSWVRRFLDLEDVFLLSVWVVMVVFGDFFKGGVLRVW